MNVRMAVSLAVVLFSVPARILVLGLVHAHILALVPLAFVVRSSRRAFLRDSRRLRPADDGRNRNLHPLRTGYSDLIIILHWLRTCP